MKDRTTGKGTEFDPVAIERWALAYLKRLSDGGKRCVLLGGSIARGQQWAHSDLEAGLLVSSHDPSIAYFNVDAGRGVEIIQLVEPDLIRQLSEVESGKLDAVAIWPIQLYRARVVSDPTGLLKRFVAQFDRHLFSSTVIRTKLMAHVAKGRQRLEKARALTAAGRPRAALCEVREAMNDGILALHWSVSELPRSNNRVDSRLRDLTTRHGRPEFYALFRDVFELETTEEVIQRDWPLVKDQVLQIAAGWQASAFFETAVDGTFSWGENASIVSVHRRFIPIIGQPGAAVIDSLDKPDWAAANLLLVRFLGLASTSQEGILRLAERVDQALAEIVTRGSPPVSSGR